MVWFGLCYFVGCVVWVLWLFNVFDFVIGLCNMFFFGFVCVFDNLVVVG